MSASWPSSTRSTSASTVASPHSSRCSPSSHRSPGCVTACSGSAGASSSSVRPFPAARQQPLQLALAKADQPEVEAQLREVRQLEPQQLVVPTRIQRQLVVGQHIRALLRLAHVPELDHRHPLQTQLPRRHDPAMSGDDPVLTVDQHGVRPAELPDARRDLRHLGIASGCADCGRRGSARPAAARRSQDRPS